MRNTTKKRAPIICAAVVIGLLVIYLAAVLFPLVGAAYGEVFAAGFLILYGSVIAAVVVGVVLALRQRLREIEGGEEEDAKQY